MPGTSALAYYEKVQLTAVKSFITFAPEPAIAIPRDVAVILKSAMFKYHIYDRFEYQFDMR